MNEILDELSVHEKKTNSSFKFLILYLGATFFVVVAGIYVGNALFGSRSLDVMIDLYNQKNSLKTEVQKLQEANSALQKEYFELIGLDPDNYNK